jgi:hypothetical protein
MGKRSPHSIEGIEGAIAGAGALGGVVVGNRVGNMLDKFKKAAAQTVWDDMNMSPLMPGAKGHRAETAVRKAALNTGGLSGTAVGGSGGLLAGRAIAKRRPGKYAPFIAPAMGLAGGTKGLAGSFLGARQLMGQPSWAGDQPKTAAELALEVINKQADDMNTPMADAPPGVASATPSVAAGFGTGVQKPMSPTGGFGTGVQKPPAMPMGAGTQKAAQLAKDVIKRAYFYPPMMMHPTGQMPLGNPYGHPQGAFNNTMGMNPYHWAAGIGGMSPFAQRRAGPG